MENRISTLTLLISLILLSALNLTLPATSYAQSIVKGCAIKYYEAAKAVDEKRASCGISKDGNGLCKIGSQIDIPIAIQGFTFTLNVSAAYRFLSELKLVPNEFRKTAKLIQESQIGPGAKLKKETKKIARRIPGSSETIVAQIISRANVEGRLCSGDHLLSLKEIRLYVEDEILRL